MFELRQGAERDLDNSHTHLSNYLDLHFCSVPLLDFTPVPILDCREGRVVGIPISVIVFVAYPWRDYLVGS